MKTFPLTTGLMLAALLVTAGGCDALSALLGSLPGLRSTTVELRNEGDFPVEVTLYYDDVQETLDGVIQETGTEREFTIPAGETETFSRPCDELQAIIIDDADLQVIGGTGPEADTDLLRDGDDFGCGDTIVFTFTHSEVVVDFDITVTTVSQ